MLGLYIAHWSHQWWYIYKLFNNSHIAVQVCSAWRCRMLNCTSDQFRKLFLKYDALRILMMMVAHHWHDHLNRHLIRTPSYVYISICQQPKYMIMSMIFAQQGIRILDKAVHFKFEPLSSPPMSYRNFHKSLTLQIMGGGVRIAIAAQFLILWTWKNFTFPN